MQLIKLLSALVCFCVLVACSNNNQPTQASQNYAGHGYYGIYSSSNQNKENQDSTRRFQEITHQKALERLRHKH